jgi:hypothetical protein
MRGAPHPKHPCKHTCRLAPVSMKRARQTIRLRSRCGDRIHAPNESIEQSVQRPAQEIHQNTCSSPDLAVYAPGKKQQWWTKYHRREAHNRIQPSRSRKIKQVKCVDVSTGRNRSAARALSSYGINLIRRRLAPLAAPPAGNPARTLPRSGTSRRAATSSARRCGPPTYLPSH